jgi:hypothetical protein
MICVRKAKSSLKRKNDKNYSNSHDHLKRGRGICFFVVCFQQTPEKNSCRFLFSRENCRSSSYLRSFFLFTEDFLLCEHETYKYLLFQIVHLTIWIKLISHIKHNLITRKMPGCSRRPCPAPPFLRSSTSWRR